MLNISYMAHSLVYSIFHAQSCILQHILVPPNHSINATVKSLQTGVHADHCIAKQALLCNFTCHIYGNDWRWFPKCGIYRHYTPVYCLL